MQIKTVTVIGANGAMGANISGIFASFGDAKVYMVGRDPEKIKIAREKGAKSVKADKVAEQFQIKVQHGCYTASSGPSFETPNECGYLHSIGTDATGMSTVPEVIVARHMGIPVFGVSLITNVHGPGKVTTHEEVQEEGAKASKKMSTLFAELLKTL